MPKIYVKDSNSDGKGLFAKKDIKKGEIVFIIKGQRTKFLINNQKQADKAGMNWVGIGKNEWIDPKKYCQYFNHSCDPNTYIKGKVTVVASRNIKKDEEITFDYSLNESDIFWKLDKRCRCGTKKCRGGIRPIQFLNEEEYKKKKHMVPKYYRKIFNNFNHKKFKTSEELKKAWTSFIGN